MKMQANEDVNGNRRKAIGPGYLLRKQDIAWILGFNSPEGVFVKGFISRLTPIPLYPFIPNRGKGRPPVRYDYDEVRAELDKLKGNARTTTTAEQICNDARKS